MLKSQNPRRTPLLLAGIFAAAHFGCTENPFSDDKVSGGSRQVSGTVRLGDGQSAEGVYIWLDGFNLGSRADGAGRFQLTLPPRSSQGGDINGVFKLYSYAANYRLATSEVVVRSGEFVYDKGYTIEVRIPFKSIRFANKETVNMGVIFERRVSRRNEQGTYPPLKPERGMFFLTQMMPMHLRDIKHYKLFELLPEITHSRKNDYNPIAGVKLSGKIGKKNFWEKNSKPAG